MANFQCNYSGLATGMVSNQGHFSGFSEMLCNHESIYILRNNIDALLSINVFKGQMNAELAETISHEAKKHFPPAVL